MIFRPQHHLKGEPQSLNRKPQKARSPSKIRTQHPTLALKLKPSELNRKKTDLRLHSPSCPKCDFLLCLTFPQEVVLKQVIAAILPQFAAIRGIPAFGAHAPAHFFLFFFVCASWLICCLWQRGGVVASLGLDRSTCHTNGQA